MSVVTRPVSGRAKSAPGLEKGKIPNVFDMVTVSIASPEKILEWSYGEVTKPETINYRTQKPERDGLFCERIFGPSKNWECYCGKYKKLKHKNIVCDKCGVEVTRSSVRRERMGHISLAVPVTHIWFLRSTPSGLGLLLNLSVKALEQVVYFAGYIVKNVDEVARKETLDQLKKDFQTERKAINDEYSKRLKECEGDKKKIDAAQGGLSEKLDDLTDSYNGAKSDLEGVQKYQILSELQYREYSMRFGHVFTAGTGAEALRECVKEINLVQTRTDLANQLRQSSGQKRKKLMKRLMVIRGLEQAAIKPEWMILTVLPVIPPDLRPMVQLDGGRFATSDLNDLYRRVINRNNRLRRLLDIGAPEVICRNEKRMLQEAVDALINNAARPGKAITRVGAGRLQLKSLSDMLKGKQGRFRQNLLGKRVDYSGRSVIVVGPQLKLHQCGLPKKMALELFKPFVIGRLLGKEIAYNIKNAERLIEWNRAEVWDVLEEITRDYYVLLNRAPTLHRLGIQAFQPVLIEGKAIQLHPLVCAAFNADFDGDQMAVHVPLSRQAQWEARNIMLSARNLLKPSEGKPIITASQDMVLGCYYITRTFDNWDPKHFVAANFHEAVTAYRLGHIKLQDRIKARINGEIIETTMGRMIFNSILPEELGYWNESMTKKTLGKIISESFEKAGLERTAILADEIKRIGFKFATKSGVTISASDISEPTNKKGIVAEASEKIKVLQKLYRKGLMTNEERYRHTIQVWTEVKNTLAAGLEGEVPQESPLYTMIDSGARGNWGQMTQLGAMKGLVVSPSGKTIELPIISSFKEGFKPLEYFIATHGGRKGKTDTALRTAGAGYLTRRLVDTVQEMIVREEDCGNEIANVITKHDSEELGESMESRIFGRVLAEDIKDKKGKAIFKKGTELGIDECRAIKELDIDEIFIRSILTCKTEHGVCRRCYGRDLATNEHVEIGMAVGIIAAQSIGEPGTQLTMRTFHSGGVAGMKDITQGLPRVEELFEARVPKTEAFMAPFSGKAKIEKKGNKTSLVIFGKEPKNKEHLLVFGLEPIVKNGQKVALNEIIARQVEGKGILRSDQSGIVRLEDGKIVVVEEKKAIQELTIPPSENILVKDGDEVTAGQKLTEGHLNLRKLVDATSELAAQRYIMKEVLNIYGSQGQSINDKHVEIIVRKMFSKARVIDPGDSVLGSGEIKDALYLDRLNKELIKKKKSPVIFEKLLLGLTRAALETDSWLSAASFQETIRVLVKAAITKKTDQLEGLKENVIIGKLIPAGKVFKRMYELSLSGESKLEEIDITTEKVSSIAPEMESVEV